MKKRIGLLVLILVIVSGCGLAPSPEEYAKAAKINAEVAITETAAAQQLSVKGTAAAVEVQATMDSNGAQATATRGAWEVQATATQQVAFALLTRAPDVVESQTNTANTNRSVGTVGLILAVLLGAGVVYYLMQMTKTRSMVAADGPTGPTMVIGNTIVPTGRMIGPATITPPGPLEVARHAALQLLGKNPELLADHVVKHDGGATAHQLLLATAGDLAALAYAAAAEAGKMVIEKGALRDGSHLTIHQAPQLPQVAPPQAQLPAEVTVNRLEVGGPAANQVQSVLERLGYTMPPMLPSRGQVVDQAMEDNN